MTLYQAVTWARDIAFDVYMELAQTDQEPGGYQRNTKMEAPGTLKINTDAAFWAETGNGATACVIRDHHGGFVLAQAKWYDNFLNAVVGEALACRDAVKMAAQFGFHKIHLETDCLELIQLWEKRVMQRSIIAPILSEINELMLASTEFVFTFASRSCNRVAHLLAKQIGTVACNSDLCL